MELGEDVLQCAEREVMEELGTTLHNPQWIGVYTDVKGTSITYPNGDKVQSPSFLFTGFVKKSEVKGDDEHMNYKWADLKEITEMKSQNFGYTLACINAYEYFSKTQQPYFG